MSFSLTGGSSDYEPALHVDLYAEEKANKLKFLDALTKLTREYSIVITGCGCCGSPWLEDLDERHTDHRYVSTEDVDVEWSSE